MVEEGYRRVKKRESKRITNKIEMGYHEVVLMVFIVIGSFL